MAQRVANFSLEAMIYLSIHEFTTPEKEGKVGILVSLLKCSCMQKTIHCFFAVALAGMALWCSIVIQLSFGDQSSSGQ